MGNQAIPISKTLADLQSQLIRNLAAEADLDSILDKVVEEATTALSASACAVFTRDPEKRSATQRAGSGYQRRFNGKHDVEVLPAEDVPELPDPGQRLGLTGWILSTGKPFLARSPEEVFGHPHFLGRQGHDLQAHAFLGVPIRGLDGEVIGVAKAERKLGDLEIPSEPFAVADELTLETIARIASRCIHYAGLASVSRVPQAVTAWAREVIEEASATEGELDSFLDIVVNVTAAAMNSNSCGIFLVDEEGKTLTQRAGIGSQALREVIRSYPWPEEEIIQRCKAAHHCSPPDCDFRLPPPPVKVGLTPWIAATGKSFYARNFAELRGHCHWRGHFDGVNFPKGTVCGAFLGVPLQVGGGTIGVIKVENTSRIGEVDTRDFSGEARQRFELLAQDVALAIMRLQAQIPARYRVIQESQRTILEILQGGFDIPDLVKKVVTETQALFRAGTCALFLQEGNRLIQQAASGYSTIGPPREYKLVPKEAIKENPAADEEVGLTVWIAVMGRKFTARSFEELKRHPHHKGTYDDYNFPADELKRCESFMGFPLRVRLGHGEEIRGVLKVESKTRYVGLTREYTYFSELDELVFELIANSVAIAIQNARLLEARREADRVLAEGEGRERAWKEFSSFIAHKMGNDAAIIRDAAKLLLRDLSAKSDIQASGRRLSDIIGACHRIHAMLRDIVQFAKPPQPKLARLQVNQLCRDAVADSFGAPGRLKLDLKLAEDVPELWGDRESLLYILREMLQNAAKALPEEGGSLTVVTQKSDGGNRIRVEFRDNGPGVPPELKEKIFEAGFKVRPQREGTGLGLAIVRKTIREHGGDVQEIGTHGQGAHFVIELPVHVPEGTVLHRILIVEDDEVLRNQLEDFVGSDAPNREIISASNEDEAIRLMRGQKFHLVITDVNLEEAGGSSTGGLQVLQASLQKTPDVPVIVVTAYSARGFPENESSLAGLIPVEAEAKRLGCFAFINRTQSDYMDSMLATATRALEKVDDTAKGMPAGA